MNHNQPFFIVFVVSVSLFSVLCESKVIVTEIMYDPRGNDNNHEWVEIYNDGDEEIDIVGGDNEGSWRFNDGSNHKLNESEFQGYMSISPGEYLVLVDDPATFLQDFSDYEGTIIDTVMSLSNNGDTIQLSDNEGKNFFEIVTYTPEMGGKNDGDSLQLVDGRWTACFPSPGFENDCFFEKDIETTSTTVKESVASTSTIPTTTTVSTQTTTSNTIFTTPVDTNKCDIGISVVTEKNVFDLSEKIKYRIKLESLNCNKKGNKVIIEHWIDDSNSSKVKNKDNSTIEFVCQYSKTYQWTPKKTGNFTIKSKIIDVSCQDSNGKNNEYSKEISVKSNKETIKEQDSIIEINEIKSKDSVKFGESFILDVDIFRGNTSENSIDFWVEDEDGEKVSDVYSLRVNSKMTKYKFSIPLYLLPNCDGKYKHGKYNIVGEGLGLITSKEIEINENSDVSCKNIFKETAKEPVKQILKTENTTQKPVVEPKITGYFTKIKMGIIDFFKNIFISRKN